MEPEPQQPRSLFFEEVAAAVILEVAALAATGFVAPIIGPLVALFGGFGLGIAFHWRAGPKMFLWMAIEAAVLLLIFAVVAWLFLAVACSGGGECI